MAKGSNTNSLTIKHVKSILLFFVFIVLCIHGNAQTKTLSINKDTIFLVLDTIKSEFDTIFVKADSLSPKIYTFELRYNYHPDTIKIAPSYLPTVDQKFTLLKGPVMMVVTKRDKKNGSNKTIQFDANGWLVSDEELAGRTIYRDPKTSRIIKCIDDEEMYDGSHNSTTYQYDSEGWLIGETLDHVEGIGITEYRNNTYNDPLALSFRCKEGWLVEYDEYYTVTKYDCFGNWLERDVHTTDLGYPYTTEYHESRIIYYKAILSDEDIKKRNRPSANGIIFRNIINSDKGGYIEYKRAGKTKYYKVYGKNEKPYHEKPFLMLVSVLERPSFLGGYKKINEYIADSIQYPIEAIQNKVEGKVKVRFKIDRLGHISNAKVVKGLSPELDKEAIRLVNTMPSWTPAKRNGKLVSVYYTLPITFSLNKNKRIIKSKP